MGVFMIEGAIIGSLERYSELFWELSRVCLEIITSSSVCPPMFIRLATYRSTPTRAMSCSPRSYFFCSALSPQSILLAQRHVFGRWKCCEIPISPMSKVYD